MPGGNVELLRCFIQLLNETREAPVELCHTNLEIHMFPGSPISGPYRGHDGLRRWRQDAFDVIKDWRLELAEVITGEDPEVMVAVERLVGRMKHTDLVANFLLAVVVRFRDGLIVRFEGYRERSEALEAAGLVG